MLLTALLANPPSNMLCRSNMLNGHAPRCCIVDGHRRPMQSSIAAGTGGQTAHCSLPPSEPAPRSRLRQSHYPHSAQPSAASFNPASVRSHSRHRPCLRRDLTEPSRFPWSPQRDSYLASIDPFVKSALWKTRCRRNARPEAGEGLAGFFVGAGKPAKLTDCKKEAPAD